MKKSLLLLVLLAIVALTGCSEAMGKMAMKEYSKQDANAKREARLIEEDRALLDYGMDLSASRFAPWNWGTTISNAVSGKTDTVRASIRRDIVRENEAASQAKYDGSLIGQFSNSFNKMDEDDKKDIMVAVIAVIAGVFILLVLAMLRKGKSGPTVIMAPPAQASAPMRAPVYTTPVRSSASSSDSMESIISSDSDMRD